MEDSKHRKIFAEALLLPKDRSKIEDILDVENIDQLAENLEIDDDYESSPS
jgi:hypothetical protein